MSEIVESKLELVPAEELKMVPLTELVGLINQGHEGLGVAAQKMAVAVAQIGAWLTAAKSRVKHGEWLGWLEENCPRMPERTARNYMRLYRQLMGEDSNRKLLADLTLDQAYRAIGVIREPRHRQIKAAPSAEAQESAPNQDVVELQQKLREAQNECVQLRMALNENNSAHKANLEVLRAKYDGVNKEIAEQHRELKESSGKTIGDLQAQVELLQSERDEAVFMFEQLRDTKVSGSEQIRLGTELKEARERIAQLEAMGGNGDGWLAKLAGCDEKDVKWVLERSKVQLDPTRRHRDREVQKDYERGHELVCGVLDAMGSRN